MTTETQTHEWFTLTDLHGRSDQYTRVNGKLYRRFSYGFCGGETQARDFMRSKHPEYRCIYENMGTCGLCMVLVETRPELYTAYQPN